MMNEQTKQPIAAVSSSVASVSITDTTATTTASTTTCANNKATPTILTEDDSPNSVQPVLFCLGSPISLSMPSAFQSPSPVSPNTPLVSTSTISTMFALATSTSVNTTSSATTSGTGSANSPTLSPSSNTTSTTTTTTNTSGPSSSGPNLGRKQSSSSLSMDRAAFLLIRIKRAFQKKKRNKNNQDKQDLPTAKRKQKPPMLRARTLPTIIPPALHIIHSHWNKNSAATNYQNLYNQPNELNNNNNNNDCSLSGTRSPELLIARDNASGGSGGVSPRLSVSSNSSTSSQKDSNKTKTSFAKLTRLLSNNPGHKISTHLATSGGGNASGGSSSSGTSGMFWQRTHVMNVTNCGQDGNSDASCFFWNHKSNSSKMKRTGSVDSLLSAHQFNLNSRNSCGSGTGEISGSEYSACPAGCSCSNGNYSNGTVACFDQANYNGNIGEQSATVYGYTDQLQQLQPTIQSPTSQNCFQTGSVSVGRTTRYSSGNATAGVATHKPYGKSSLTGPGSIGLYNFYQDPKSSTYYLPSDNMMPFSGVGQHSFYGNRPGKIPTSVGTGKRQMSIDVNSVGIEGWKKSDRKKFEKLSKFNFDQQALFSAVENENFDRTRMIIETTDVDINSHNSDGFTPLDISLMLLNMQLIKYLQSNGAREADSFASRSSRESHLNSLLKESEHCVIDLNICHRQTANGTGGLSSALLKEKERQLVFWERRLRLLQRLKKGFDILEPPPPPLSVHVEIVGGQSLLVHYFPPIRLQDKRNIITKYKIEWSDNNFDSVCQGGSVLITDLAARHEFVISNLKSEQCYNIRIASGNCKGFSDYCYPLINQTSPSTWRSIDNKQSNISERVLEIDNLFRQIINSRQTLTESDQKTKLTIDSENGSSGFGPSLSTTVYQQKRMRKSIKNFFGAANKFQKVMKRGVYFASLVYHDERVLVTNDEVLPIIEIDDIYPSSLQNDFNWLLKISCTWEDAKMFRKDMEKSQSSSVAHFRTRILLAVEQMQSSLGLHDLGKLYYKPLRDSEGTVVFCAIKCLADPKTISCLSLRWLPLAKLQKRHQAQQQLLLLQQQQQQANSREMFSERVSDSGISVTGFDSSPRLIGDILLSTLDEMIEYHKACNNELPRGLYIGYVKLKSSLEMMSVMVAKSHPNILPYAKIRDNPHVSRQEWAAMKMCLRNPPAQSGGSLCGGGSSSTPFRSFMPTSASQLHLATLNQAAAAGALPTTPTEPQPSPSPSPQLSVMNRSSLYGSHLNISSSANCSPTPPTPTSTVPSPQAQLANFFQLARGTVQSRCSSSASAKSQGPQQSGNYPTRLNFTEKLSFQQLLKFLQMLTQTAGHFLQSIGVTEADHCDLHRLYSLEVIELSQDVSFILLLPPPDEVCSIFNQTDSIQVPNLIYLPLKIFELIHMNTYQKNFTSRYSRISALLELDIMVAQQAQREAFSTNEVTTAKARVNQLQEFQTQLDECCRSMRWIMDVVAYARDRQLTVGVSLSDVQQTLYLMDKEILEADDSDDRLFHNIPSISLSTPAAAAAAAAATAMRDYHGHSINIESECNSTPTSPPPTMDMSDSLLAVNGSSVDGPDLIGPGTMPCLMRRKSRDDSYLEEHHRHQNHFNTAQHHRFHHQYGLNGSCGSSAACHKLYQNHSDSIDSNETANSQSQSLLSYVTVTNAPSSPYTPPTIVASGSLSGSASMSPTKPNQCGDDESPRFTEDNSNPSDQDENSSTTIQKFLNESPDFEKDFGPAGPGIGAPYTSKSSYSLLDHQRTGRHRESLTVVDKAALEDMRRCVSASKLLPSSSRLNRSLISSSTELSLDTVTKSNLTPSPELSQFVPDDLDHGHIATEAERITDPDSTILMACPASDRGNYFFGHDMEMYDNEVLLRSSVQPTTMHRTTPNIGQQIQHNLDRPNPNLGYHLSISNQSIDTSLSDISLNASFAVRSSNQALNTTTTTNNNHNNYNQLSSSQLSINSVPLSPFDDLGLAGASNTSPPLVSRLPDQFELYRPLSRAGMLFSSEHIDDLIEEEEEELYAHNHPPQDPNDTMDPYSEIPSQKSTDDLPQSSTLSNQTLNLGSIDPAAQAVGTKSLNPFVSDLTLNLSPGTLGPTGSSYLCDTSCSVNNNNPNRPIPSLDDVTFLSSFSSTAQPVTITAITTTITTTIPTTIPTIPTTTTTNQFNDNFKDLIPVLPPVSNSSADVGFVWSSIEPQPRTKLPEISSAKSSPRNWSRFDSVQEPEPVDPVEDNRCCLKCRCNCKSIVGGDPDQARPVAGDEEDCTAINTTTTTTTEDTCDDYEDDDGSGLIQGPNSKGPNSKGPKTPTIIATTPSRVSCRNRNVDASSSRIVDIYTAYQCSVPIGTSLKLKINSQTVAGEIIETVVNYFNKIGTTKIVRPVHRTHHHRHCSGSSQNFRSKKRSAKQTAQIVPGPYSWSPSKVVPFNHCYSKQDLHQFSLLAVYTSNIKQLNWNFPVMNLQSPWNEARLCVKLNSQQDQASGDCRLNLDLARPEPVLPSTSDITSSSPPNATTTTTGSSTNSSPDSISDCSCSTSSDCST